MTHTYRKVRWIAQWNTTHHEFHDAQSSVAKQPYQGSKFSQVFNTGKSIDIAPLKPFKIDYVDDIDDGWFYKDFMSV